MGHLTQSTLASFRPALRNSNAAYPSERPIKIALVNNMPDRALQDTERCYRDLATAAAAATAPRADFSLFALNGISRSQSTLETMAYRYHTLDDLRQSDADAVIVTGTEPRTTNLPDEQFWRPLTQVLDWAEANAIPTMLSCLSAHAAALHFDGISRTQLPRKCSGVFKVEKLAHHPLTTGMPAHWQTVHSRLNDLNEPTLRAHGYTILGRSETAGVHLFVKQQRNLLVGFQGHPEYGSDTLLKEYKRDVARFLRHEQPSYPEAPTGYFAPSAVQRLSEFRELAERHRDIASISNFPTGLTLQSPASTWWPASICVFSNWLRAIESQRSRPRTRIFGAALSA